MTDSILSQTIEILQQQLNRLRQQAAENAEQLIESLPATLRKMQDELEDIRLQGSSTEKITQKIPSGTHSTGSTADNDESPGAFLEDQPQQFCRHSADGTLTFVNDAFCRYYNRPQKALIGHNILSVRTTDSDRLKAFLASANPQDPVIVIEEQLKTPGREIYWHQWTDRAIFDEHGQLVEFQLVGKDITTLKQAEETLRKLSSTVEQTEIEEVQLQKRLRRQHEALVRLSTHPASAEGRLSEALTVTTQAAAEALDVDRVNIWRLSPDQRELRCLTSFEFTEREHTAGRLLQASAYPLYFAALETLQVIDATDVSKDSRTAELTTEYWKPLGITSAIQVTVRLHGQVIGVICYEHIGVNRVWTADEITFASQIADLVAQAFLHTKARRRAEELESTRDILRTLNATIEISDAFPTIASSLKAITGCERTSLSKFDENKEWFIVTALDQSGQDLESEIRGLLVETAAGEDALAGRHHRATNLAAETVFPLEKTLYQAGFRSRLCLPLRIGDRILGTLNLAWRHQAGYNTAHLPLLDQVADAIALAIERKRLFDEARSRASQQEALNAVIAAAMAAPDMLQLAETALDHTLQALKLEVGGIWVAGERAFRGLTTDSGRSITQAIRAAKLDISGPIAIEDWTGEAVPEPMQVLTNLVAKFGIQASLIIPILAEGKQIGGLALAAPEPRPWAVDEIALVEAIGRQLGSAAERMRLLDRTRRQAHRVQQIMDTVPEGVLFLDAKRRVALANPAAEEYLAVLADAKIGDALIHLGGQPLDSLLRPESAEKPYHEIKITDPAPGVFELMSRPLTDEIETGGWVMLLQDVTESRRVQEQVREQERLAAVGQLAAGIAHDFNNLLTGIIGFAELIQMRLEIPEPGPAYLDQITKLGRQAANLIGQILDFSRRSVSQQQSLDLVPFLKESIKFLERTIPEIVHIVLEVTPGEFVIMADPTKIQQVLTNLAVNARDVMPTGGELRFRLAQLSLEREADPPCADLPPGDWVVLAISDTGSGIPAEIQPHIFEPFFTTKERGKGTGLGLAQVYGIVKQHHGYIDFESGSGQGTTFTVYLPALVGANSDAEEIAPVKVPRGHGETLLLIEDEPDVLEVNQLILEELGYRVLTSTNGKQALEIYADYKEEIALVLTDMVMPEMDGLALYKALKARYPEVKVLLMTGYPLNEESNKLLSEGLVNWLQKPVDFNHLAQVISHALDAA